MNASTDRPSRETIVEIAQAVRERGPIAFSAMPRTGQPLLDAALELLADGVSGDTARRHLERCIAVERAKAEELFAFIGAAFELVADGANERYIDLVIGGLEADGGRPSGR